MWAVIDSAFWCTGVHVILIFSVCFGLEANVIVEDAENRK